AGTFREDLFYRLNVVPITLPPLRERSDDIPDLAAHFIRKFNERLNKSVSGVTPQAMERLRSYRWPGNIRELENIIERAVLFADSELITERDLSSELAAHPSAVGVPGETLSDGAAAAVDPDALARDGL